MGCLDVCQDLTQPIGDRSSSSNSSISIYESNFEPFYKEITTITEKESEKK